MQQTVQPPEKQIKFGHQLKPAGHTNYADTESFKQGMRRLAGAVNVISTEVDGVRFGLTATAVCSLSAAPPRLIACVNMNGKTFRAIQDRGAISVNALDVSHDVVAKKFAGMGEENVDNYSVGNWSVGTVLGMPILKDACCSFECSVSDIIDSGTHAVIIGDIVNASSNAGGRPLVYHDGKFGGFSPS